MTALPDETSAASDGCVCLSGEHPPKSDYWACPHRRKLDLPSSSRCTSQISYPRSARKSKEPSRSITAAIKGFFIGGRLAALTILARLTSRKLTSSSGSVKRRNELDREAISTAVKETLRYGLFLGTFAGLQDGGRF